MSNANLSNFIVNSDYPLPERTGATKAVLFVQSGSTVPSRTVTINAPVSSEARIFRVAFQCSRTNDITYASGHAFMNYKFNDGSFNVYIGAAKNGQIKCSATVYQGLDKTKTDLESDVTFTFYISGFKLP